MNRPLDRQKATDSPWFWLYLFSTFALIAVVLIQSKYAQRQSLIERKWQATRMVNGQEKREEAMSKLAEEKPLRSSSITAVILILAVSTVIGWVIFWRGHIRGWKIVEKDSTCDETS